MPQHSSCCVIMTLAHSLYEESKNWEAVVEMETLIVASGRRVRSDFRKIQNPPQYWSNELLSDVATQEVFSEERVAHIVVMRLKDSGKKFSGDWGNVGWNS